MSSTKKNKKKSPDDVNIDEILASIRSIMNEADVIKDDAKPDTKKAKPAAKKEPAKTAKTKKPTAQKKARPVKGQSKDKPEKDDNILVLTEIAPDEPEPLVLTDVEHEEQAPFDAARQEDVKEEIRGEDFIIPGGTDEGEADKKARPTPNIPETLAARLEKKELPADPEIDAAVEDMVRSMVKDYVAEYLNQHIEGIIKKIAEEELGKPPKKS